MRSDLPRIQQGDRVGLRLLFDVQRLVVYLNSRSVVEIQGFPTYEEYFPCVTFGNAGYQARKPAAVGCWRKFDMRIVCHEMSCASFLQVRLLPVPRIPLTVPRWLPDALHPKRFALEEEEMVVRGLKSNTCVSVPSSVEFDSGRQYFEVRVNAVHPEGELCVGLASSRIVDNFRMVPFVEFRHAGYKSDGQLVAFGEVVQDGLPRIFVPDRVGVLVDFDKEEMLFFHEGHPVGRIVSSHVRGRSELPLNQGERSCPSPTSEADTFLIGAADFSLVSWRCNNSTSLLIRHQRFRSSTPNGTVLPVPIRLLFISWHFL